MQNTYDSMVTLLTIEPFPSHCLYVIVYFMLTLKFYRVILICCTKVDCG